MKTHVDVRACNDPSSFQVTVHEGGGRTTHEVTLRQETLRRLSGRESAPEKLIEAAFHFLLDREPKESIMNRFDLTVISHYFPEFEERVSSYLSSPEN